MTLKKKLLIGFPLVLVLLIALALLFLDQIAKKAVEVGGEEAMGVPTALDSISLRPALGTGSLKGLQVSNPKGFDTPFFMRLDKGDAALDVGSVFKDTVVMKSIELDGLQAYLEKNKQGSNYETILANMKKGEEKGGGEEKGPGEEAGGKKFLVEQVVVRNIKVRADLAVAGEKLSSVDLEIHEIRLENVGSDTGSGVVMSQLMGTIVKAVLVAIVEQGAGVLPEVMLNGLGVGLKGLGKVGVKVIGKAGGEAVKVIGDVGKTAGGAVKDAIHGVGGLLGGGDKDKDKDKDEDKKDGDK